MNFFYTTSVAVNDPQTKPSISLGGFKSSSLVRNNDFDNLFGELSVYTINKSQDEYLGLMLQNTSGVAVENISLYFIYPENCYTKYQIAGVNPAQNGDGDFYIERIPTRYSQPLYAEFEDATLESPYDLGSLSINGQIGVWLKRSILMDIIKEDLSNLYTTDPNDSRRYIEVEKGVSDSIQIVLSWDNVTTP